MCEICWEVTIKTPELRQWRHSGIFISNFEQISHIILVFLLDFKQVIFSWAVNFRIFWSDICDVYHTVWTTVVVLSLSLPFSNFFAFCLGD